MVINAIGINTLKKILRENEKNSKEIFQCKGTILILLLRSMSSQTNSSCRNKKP